MIHGFKNSAEARDWASRKEITNDTHVITIPFPVRVLTLCRNEGIETVGQLRSLSDNQFLRNYNFGKTSLAVVRAVIGPHDPEGLYLNEAVEDALQQISRIRVELHNIELMLRKARK